MTTDSNTLESVIFSANMDCTLELIVPKSTSPIFAEAAIPLMENLDAQVAVRVENADDYGTNAVGKVAIGYSPTDWFKLRSSNSTSFRAPNLVTVNEGLVVRNNSQEDPLYTKAIGENYENYSIQRVARGNDALEGEESTNTSLGIVFTPVSYTHLTLPTICSV